MTSAGSRTQAHKLGTTDDQSTGNRDAPVAQLHHRPGTTTVQTVRAQTTAKLLERSRDWKWLDGVYAMQLSVRGNQNEGSNRVRAMPTTVNNKEFSGSAINPLFLVLGSTPKPTVVSPHMCDNRELWLLVFPTKAQHSTAANAESFVHGERLLCLGRLVARDSCLPASESLSRSSSIYLVVYPTQLTGTT